MAVVKVVFDRPKHSTSTQTEYAYFCDYDVAVGDRVIVDSLYNGLTAVTVVSINAGTASRESCKEVVCTIDDSRYRARMAARARREEIGAELAWHASNVVAKDELKAMRKTFKGNGAALDLLDELEALNHISMDAPDVFLEKTIVSTFKDLGLEIRRADTASLQDEIDTCGTNPGRSPLGD